MKLLSSVNHLDQNNDVMAKRVFSLSDEEIVMNMVIRKRGK